MSSPEILLASSNPGADVYLFHPINIFLLFLDVRRHSFSTGLFPLEPSVALPRILEDLIPCLTADPLPSFSPTGHLPFVLKLNTAQGSLT